MQQSGVVRTLRNGTLLPAPFLDIRAKTSAGGERGLLGLAFPPGFAQKQRFYVDYTDLSGNTVIAQYRMASGGQTRRHRQRDRPAEASLSRSPITTADRCASDPTAICTSAWAMAALAATRWATGRTWACCSARSCASTWRASRARCAFRRDNPFVNTAGARGEIWAYGLRNPWRFSFDRATRDLWIADVGQDTYEEVDLQPAASRGGENYGWNQMEGMHCYQAGCRTQGLTLPVAEYTHTAGDCSVTGGFMYRGRQSPGLRGLYFYGDYCSGTIWALEPQGTAWSNRLVLSSGFAITTFGEDEAGEIYVADGKTAPCSASRAARRRASRRRP